MSEMAAVTKISVVIPCYNAAAFLSDTLVSLSRQQFPPHEIIVVDDGSTDSSSEIARQADPRITVVRLRKNCGIGQALNTGIGIATGDYLHFCDADDLLHPTAFQRVALAAASCGNPDLVMFGWATFTECESKILSYHFPPDTILPAIYYRNPCPPVAMLVSRALVERIGGFDPVMKRRGHDWDFTGRAIISGAKLVVLRETLAYYRVHDKQVTRVSSREEKSRSNLRVFARLVAETRRHPNLLQTYGSDVFWQAVIRLELAYDHWLKWSEMRDLALQLKLLVTQLPSQSQIKKSLTGKLIGCLGVRAVLFLRYLRRCGFLGRVGGGPHRLDHGKRILS